MVRRQLSFNVIFTDNKAKVLLERSIDGKVRFFGDNLKATSDFAKRPRLLRMTHFSSIKHNPPIERCLKNSASPSYRVGLLCDQLPTCYA